MAKASWCLSRDLNSTRQGTRSQIVADAHCLIGLEDSARQRISLPPHYVSLKASAKECQHGKESRD